MKKSAFLLVAFFAPALLFAQNKNAFKINPLSLSVKNLSISYERVLTKGTSLQLHGAYWLGGSLNGVKFDGFTFTPELRFYVTDHGAPEGFYLAPFGRYESLSAKDKDFLNSDAKVTLSRVGVGVDLGYQFVFSKKITWDIF